MSGNDHAYDDIINLEYRKSTVRKHMSVSDRAAQFAPFAALTGHDMAVEETARLTERKIELDEYSKEELNQRLMLVQANIESGISASFTYFEPDDKKSGGRYVTACGNVKKIKEVERLIVMEDGCEIPVDDIIMIESGLFNTTFDL